MNDRRPAPANRLSARQLEVLELVAKGRSNDEIAALLSISPATVRTHVTAILATLGASNRTAAAAAFYSWTARPERVAELLARPAITVLPLVTLDADDARASSLASAIGSDLASLFARWCWFPVITSAPAAARDEGEASWRIGRRLGARFVVDGGLRVGPTAWRLQVRIDDTRDGACIWTERYDFVPSAVFGVEDSICNAIVASAYPVLVAHVAAQASPPPAQGAGDVSAWQIAHAAMALQLARHERANVEARRLFKDAIDRQADLVLAHYGLGLASYDEVLNQWSPVDAAIDRLGATAHSCIELAPHAAEGYYLLARHQQTKGDNGLATRALEIAIAKNPSFAPAYALLAQTLVATGRDDEGLERMKQATHLGPRAFVAGLAVVHFVRRDYREALDAAEAAALARPNYPFAHAVAAASAWYIGDRARAARHARVLRRVAPDFDPTAFGKTFGSRVEAVKCIVRALNAVADGSS